MAAQPATLSHHLRCRDAATASSHGPVEEETDSVCTASEPAEPLTPTSHASEGASSHAFRHDDHAEDGFTNPRLLANDTTPKSIPQDAPQPHPQPTPSSARSAPTHVPPLQVEQRTRQDRVRLGKRVGSFVRNTLHRSHSSKDGSTPTQQSLASGVSSSPRPRLETHSYMARPGVLEPAFLPPPAVDMPRPDRRHSSFLLSRRSDRPPHATSPPKTASAQTSPFAPRPLDARAHRGRVPAPSPAISTMDRPRPGITWAGSGNVRPSRKQGWGRKRSASTEQLTRFKQNGNENNNTPTAGMVSTFSKPAVEGMGVRARRLSMSLPSDFIIDWCELDKEFKSSSLMPGKRGKILGKGATSEVRIMARRGALSRDEVLVAVKEFRERDRGETEEDYVLKIKSEYSIAKSLHHPNIVETVRLCTNRGRWNHVMEFCTYGEVYSLVERKLFTKGPEGFYTQDDRLCLFKQLLRGIGYLHSHGIAHRDIKLENLLLDRDGRLKISDFGVAEVFSGEHPGLRASGGECGKNMGEVRLSAPGLCGSLPYIAPEVLDKSHSYDPRPLDVWSSAVVYLTMTFGGCPWKVAKTDFEYYARFKKGWDVWLKAHPTGIMFDGPDGQPTCGKLFSLIEPPSVQRLILHMLHPRPEKRIPIHRVLETQCISSIDCCCPESFDEQHATSRAKTPGARKSMYHYHNHIPPKPENKDRRSFVQRSDIRERS